jgi:hypothetical protein
LHAHHHKRGFLRSHRDDFKGHNSFFPEGAFYPISSPHTSVHSFSQFVSGKEYFDAHPEYFALVKGKRLPCNDAVGPGQLCLTNKDVVHITLEKLRQFIAEDRKAASASNVPPPRIYWINQSDIYHGHCQCDDCQAIVTREGGESGPLVAFMNAVGAAIELQYSDILVGTIAYNLTSDAPMHLRPRNNVLIGWCDVYSRVDGIKPLAHPHNIDNYRQITTWSKVAPSSPWQKSRFAVDNPDFLAC